MAKATTKAASSIDFGRQVIRAEIDALAGLAGLLDHTFDRAVELILNCKGNAVITGVGKPWIVGQKISATMASTGTPSIALHPTDAAHGDLGRIQPGDVVIAISNSGTSEEVVRLLPLLKRDAIPIIGMTGNIESELARYSDVVLNLGKINEACPLDLAPSASTTAMVALGDALALAVMDRRGFAKEDYARFHPAGALGRKLMRIDEMMRSLADTAVVQPEAHVKEALAAMTRVKAAPACIVDRKGLLLGVFTDGDLRRLVKDDDSRLNAPIGDVMIKPGIRIKRGELVTVALHLMEANRIAEVPVVDDTGILLGHVQFRDLLKMGIM